MSLTYEPSSHLLDHLCLQTEMVLLSETVDTGVVYLLAVLGGIPGYPSIRALLDRLCLPETVDSQVYLLALSRRQVMSLNYEPASDLLDRICPMCDSQVYGQRRSLARRPPIVVAKALVVSYILHGYLAHKEPHPSRPLP